MKSYQCKCGACLYSESGMPPKDCQGCEKCGTTYARHPEGHRSLQPHKLKPQYNRDTGKLSHSICTECYARIKETT
jgi:hypothetical protein